jgi:membrane protein involved in colicin uptake
MLVYDTEVLGVGVERSIATILDKHQSDMIAKCLELSDAKKRAEVQIKLAEYDRKEADMRHTNAMHKLGLEKKLALENIAQKEALAEKARAQKQAETQAEADLQKVLDVIQNAKLERDKKADAARIETEKQLAEIEKARQKAYADTVKTIMESVSEELVAALTSNANADMLETVTKAMSPYAMANGESVADVTNKLLRGTSLEKVIDNLGLAKVK